MADIDSLQIKISADANKASKSLDELANRMLKFAQSLSFDTGKLTSISSGIRSISDAATGFKGGKAKEIAALANSLSKFDSIDTNSVRGVGSALQEFSAGLSGAKEIDTSGILNAVSAVQKLGSKSATAGTKNLITAKNDLVEFVNGLNNIQAMTFDPTGVTNAADAISKLGGTYVTQAVKNLPSLSAQMQNFVRQMNGIGELNFDMSGLTSMVSAISRLGSTASGRAVSNIPELGRVLKELFTTLSTAPHVSTNIIQMTEALAKLAKTGASSGRAVTSLSNSLNLFSNSASKAQKRSFSLASAIGKLYAGYFLLFRGFGKVKESIELSSALTEVQNVVDTTFGDMSYKVDDFAKSSIQQFGMSELAVKQYSSTFQAMGVAMGISNRAIGDANQFLNKQTDGYVGLSSSLSDVSLNLTKLTADIASFYNKSQDVVAEDLESIFTGMVVPMRKYGLDLTQASLKEFALKNGLDANVESMTQAEKTMLRYQYVLANTTAAQGDFAKTADTWANQVRILKQNFEQLGGTIGGSLINAFKPFLQTLNNVLLAVNSFAEKVTAALSSIFGWKYESGGKGVADSWTDSMDDFSDSESNAASNAKKLKNALMGIDELNIISQDNGTGGSGGTGGITGTEDVDGGKLVKTDTIFENYKSEIKNLEQLGAYIGDALSKAMESIDWQKTYEKARNFGTGLAQFLNGLISPRLFGNVGKTIAGALNTSLNFLNSFGKTFDWKNFGESIAEGINKFFKTFDFKLLATTLNTWVNGIKETIYTAIKNVKWSDVFKGFKDFFGNLELDTAFLLAIPAIKKLSPLIVKLGKNLSSVWKITVDLAKTFNGSETAMENLSTVFPKLSSAVYIAGGSFREFKSVVDVTGGDIFAGINAAITNIRNNMSGFAKGVTGVVSVVGEFAVVKDAFFGLVSGSDGVAESIAKIAVTAGVAGTALTVAFGPAGIAVTAITGVIAAIAGINSALNEIKAEEIGNSIKNAFTVPGGVPIGDVVSNIKNAFVDASSGFDIISEKSQEMKSVQSNIENTWIEIYKIQDAMETGVISVEDGKAQLEQLFSELAVLTEQKFSAMSSVIISAYGEGGTFSKALSTVGADTEQAIDTMVEFGYKNAERAKEIAEELLTLPTDSERYKELQIELAKLTGKMDSVEKAASDFAYNMNALQGKIDYSEIFLDDGSIDTEALQRYLNEAADALQEYESDLDEAGKEIAQYWQGILNSTEASEEDKAVAKSQLDYLPEAISLMKIDAQNQVTQFTDMMQNDFIEKTGQILQDASDKWENENWFTKWAYSDNQRKYFEDALSKQQSNIELLSSTIESSMEELGIKGAGWGAEASKSIVNSLFDKEIIDATGSEIQYGETLKENYQQIIENATDGIQELVSEKGKSVIDGYAEGIYDNAEAAQNAAIDFTQKVLDSIAETQDSHSPSKETIKLAEYAVEGYKKGIESNTKSAVTVAGKFTTNILNKVGEMISPMNQIGVNAMQGLLNGMSSMEESLYKKAQDIANNIANTIKSALQIHSPSRVTYELGGYTMQGLQLGMENRYASILESLDSFSKDVAVAPVPDISEISYSIGNQSLYGNMDSQIAFDTTSVQNTISSSTEAQITLIQEGVDLLRQLLDKDPVAIGDREIARANARGQKAMGYQIIS